MGDYIYLITYLLILLLGIVIGTLRYRYITSSMRMLLLMLIVTFIIEIAAPIAVTYKYIYLKNVLYHFFNVVQLIIIALIFIKINKPYHHKKLLILNFSLWPVLGLLNIIFLQPSNGLNTNFLMLESLAVITLSLYTIYRLLDSDSNSNIFRHPYFWLSIIWLVEWSTSFFFWAFIKILNRYQWKYMKLAININIIVGILVYTSLALVLLLYPKKKNYHESH